MVGLYAVDSHELSVGRLGPCQIICEGCEEMSAKHITFYSENGREYAVMAGKNGGYINGHFVEKGEKVNLSFGDEIEICSIRILWMSELIAIDSSREIKVCLSEAQGLGNSVDIEYGLHNNEYFSKIPRPVYNILNDVIELDAAPEKRVEETQSTFLTIGPAFTMALPMVIGFLVSRLALKTSGAMSSAFMYTGIITATASALLGVFWGIININNRKKQMIIREEQRKNAYTEYVLKAEQLIREQYNKNRGILRMKYPSIEEYLPDEVNRYLLWNRNIDDEDFLKVRLGTGNIEHAVNISIPKDRFSIVDDELRQLPKKLKHQYMILRDVPMTVDLRRERIIGIVSESERTREELFLEMIVSLGVCILPSELKMVCYFANNKIKDDVLRSVRFMPHLSYNYSSLIIKSDTHIAEAAAEIKALIEDGLCSRIAVFTDCYERIAKYLGKAEEINYIIVVNRFEELTSECQLIIQRDQGFSGMIKLSGNHFYRREVHFDMVTAESANKYSRLMQGVRIKETLGKKALPKKVGFYEIFGKEIGAKDIWENWQNNTTKDSIVAPLGIAENGEILMLDVHEKNMGPHGLIAGMTGSGKSEILQTFILSLAVRYSPADVGFFLIDYKGGGMATLFDGLPHVLGSVSNLSGRLIYRAMASVKSENLRRQRLFLKLSVSNISEYQEKYRSGVISEPLAHIFIVIDEFAELKREEPEFMKELISVARIGRSLGIHLILATQKPAGVVDDNIQSNSRFRICLKLQDKSDSMEMLHKPDAAFISNTGQAILQVGNDEIYTTFQGAYTMDKSRTISHADRIKISDEFGQEYSKKYEREENTENNEPQLSLVLKEISNIGKRYPLIRGKPLWIEPLKENIYFKDIEEGDTGKKEPYEIDIGIYDCPAFSLQDRLSINIVSHGHHIILGTLQSGKSTLLATITFALLKNSHNDLLNLYFLDFSQGMLKPYRNFVLTGGYISEENEEDVEKMITMLTGIITQRKKAFGGVSYRQFVKQYKASKAAEFPAIFLIIDGLGSFRERTLARFDKEIEKILKNGEACGVYVIASAFSVTAQEVTKRMFDCFSVCIPLQLKDRYEYKEALSVKAEDIFMPESIRGRGLFCVNDQVVEFQAVQPVYAENEFEKQHALEEEISKQNAVIKERLSEENVKRIVKKVPVVPKNLNINTFLEELRERSISGEDVFTQEGIPIGFFEKTGVLFYLPYKENLVVIISGRSGSGKSNLINHIGFMYEIWKTKSLEDGDDGRDYVNQNSVNPSETNQDTKLLEKLDCDYVNQSSTKRNYVNRSEINQTSITQNDFLNLPNGMRIYVYDEKMQFSLLSEIKAEAGGDPYVIHLGGALDRQNIADFSYIPYSKQTELCSSGHGVVRKTLRGYAYGEIIVPMFNKQ